MICFLLCRISTIISPTKARFPEKLQDLSTASISLDIALCHIDAALTLAQSSSIVTEKSMSMPTISLSLARPMKAHNHSLGSEHTTSGFNARSSQSEDRWEAKGLSYPIPALQLDTNGRIVLWPSFLRSLLNTHLYRSRKDIKPLTPNITSTLLARMNSCTIQARRQYGLSRRLFIAACRRRSLIHLIFRFT